MYRIQFDNGVTVITPNWETVKRYVMGGGVETVTINGCGEILYDAQFVALRTPST